MIWSVDRVWVALFYIFFESDQRIIWNKTFPFSSALLRHVEVARIFHATTVYGYLDSWRFRTPISTENGKRAGSFSYFESYTVH